MREKEWNLRSRSSSRDARTPVTARTVCTLICSVFNSIALPWVIVEMSACFVSGAVGGGEDLLGFFLAPPCFFFLRAMVRDSGDVCSMC